MTSPAPLTAPPTPMALARGWSAWASRAAGLIEPRARDAAARADGRQRPRAGAPLHGDPWPVWAYRITGERPYPVEGGLALLSVSGLILPSLGLIGWEHATGCAEVAWQVETALVDPDVNGLALIVDSPGGVVTGVNALAAQIRRARAVKPVAAVVTGAAYSAGYWISSAADGIAADRTAGVGSIGVMLEHVDDTGMMERLGLARTIVAEGARKAECAGALDDAALARLRAEVADLRDVFVDAVVAGRAGAVSRDAVMSTESACLTAPEALALGLIDAVADPREALAAFAVDADARGGRDAEPRRPPTV